jgi:glucan 1,3-beta-glucosidase
LQSYYSDAYQRVRKYIPAERGTVFFHDGFRANAWGDFMQTPDWKNVVLDTHMYQCFSENDKQRDIQSQLEFAVVNRKTQLDSMREHHRCIVGEWSCSLPPKTLRGLRGMEYEAALRAYGSGQLLSYDSTEGWFFWTYRTEAGGAWSFRDCTERGWLPEHYSV